MKDINQSLDMLLKFEEKYCSTKIANSQIMYWFYKIQGVNSLKKLIPEIDDWVYHYERFLDCGGNPYELKQPNSFLGHYF